MHSLRFDEVEFASADWGFNCGPAVICAITGMSPDELRPHLLDFERRCFMNPSQMWRVLLGLRLPIDAAQQGRACVAGDGSYPPLCVVRVQWDGPWTAPGVPIKARYPRTHWIAVSGSLGERCVFDINAVHSCGGWIPWQTWTSSLVPWLLREAHPKATGKWWPTHIWAVQPRGIET